VTRGYVGVEAQQITGATAKALHLSDNSGALLAGVQPDSPAAKAGLQPGDVIETVNGTKIANPKELAMNVAAIPPGEETHLTVLRDGQTKDFTLKVGAMPNEQTASNDSHDVEHRAELGVALGTLSPDVRNQLDLPESTRGAVVERVQPGSPAEAAGLQPGDVVVGVGTHAVTSPSEAVKEVRSAMKSSDHALALRVIRDGKSVFVGVNLDQSDQG
jgi:serine protease Do